jgi:hypothetical protein
MFDFRFSKLRIDIQLLFAIVNLMNTNSLWKAEHQKSNIEHRKTPLSLHHEITNHFKSG